MVVLAALAAVWAVLGRIVLDTAERRHAPAPVAAVQPAPGGAPASLPPGAGVGSDWPGQRRRIVAWLAGSWTLAAGLLTV
ncbi:MAG TPA: hypothetical protein VNK50_00980, partial [Calidithermus sp.]|nr:hypothetical protein [Calidithermus sp.]